MVFNVDILHYIANYQAIATIGMLLGISLQAIITIVAVFFNIREEKHEYT